MHPRRRGGQRLAPVTMLVMLATISVGCHEPVVPSTASSPQPSPPESLPVHDPLRDETANLETARERMVASQLAARDIFDQRVLDAMRRVPRHEFVPSDLQLRAYNDSPLPIGQGQTISQPYIVALMTQLAEPQAQKKALDIGTGSGYQAAILAELVKSVHSIEIVEPLAVEAAARLKTMGYDNIQVRHGDGYHGWETEAPFDIIIVAAAPDHVPPALVDQLAPGGKMIIPVGERFQKLMVIEKDQDGTVIEKNIAPVAFVPMTGSAEN